MSENLIEELIYEIGGLTHLEQLFARHNKIKALPNLDGCCKLKDLDLSFNQIAQIDPVCFENIGYIVNMNLRDNKLTELPISVQHLQNLERLDLTNNNLTK
jgi:internalin A